MTSTTTDRRLGLTGSAAIKVPCKAATTANITLSGAQTIDGVSCVTGDRVLVKSQTSSVDNGVYVVDSGTWTRDLDFDGTNDVVTGTIVMVLNGTANANTYWRVSTTGTITFGTSAITFAAALAGDAKMVSFTPSGTGGVSRTVAEELGETISPFQYGGAGDGTTDDSAAILAASVAGVAQGKDVDFGGHTWLLGTALSLTTAHNNLRWRLRGATIKKGFNGDLVTLTNTASFALDGVGVIEGQGATYSGKGFVLSGSGTTNHYFGPGILFNAFANAHIEIGADAGKYVKIDSNFRVLDASHELVISCTGTDTGAMQRDINGSMNGYVSLVAAQSVHVRSPLLTRVETDSNCDVVTVCGVSWSNNGSAMTLNGAAMVVTGCRFAGDVTLSSSFSGAFVGNVQTSGTFTNSTTAGNAIVHHHPLSANYVNVAKHELDVQATTAFQIQTRALISAGDADLTFTPGASGPDIVYATSLTANRTVTLSTTGARNGMTARISRPAGDTGGPWTVTVGATGTTLATKTWCEVIYTGSFWRVLTYGTLP